MSSEKTYAGVLGYLQRLDNTLEANIGDLPRFQGAREMIQEILTRGHEVAKQQAALIAAKQEMSQQLKTLIADGQRVATAVRTLLKQHYGLRSEKLAEFGVQPFRGRAFRTENRGRHRKPAASEASTPQPAVPTQAS
jgi:phosphoglycerate-specific signal transduction histidine kinase